MRWIGYMAWIRNISFEFKILVGNPEGKRPHGR
jgi:hypothetical protein